jgi:hypothetical protein
VHLIAVGSQRGVGNVVALATFEYGE